MKITYRRNLYFVAFDDEDDYVFPVPSMSKVWIPLESLWAEVERNTYPEPLPSPQISAYAPNRSYNTALSPSTSSTENPAIAPALFSFTESRKKGRVPEGEITDHESAFAYFARFLEKHTSSMCVTVLYTVAAILVPCASRENSYHHIESLSDLARLHSGRALVVIEKCLKSIFHSTLPDYVARCAIDPVDTSMGLTSLDGLPGATRAGHVNPLLIFHYTSHVSAISRNAAEAETVEITSAEYVLNRQAGWAALTGTLDFSIIDHPCETPAFNPVVDRIMGHVGGGAVFSGDISQRSALLERCGCLGFGLDECKNKGVDEAYWTFETDAGGRCQTDEQIEMARQDRFDD
ncbi:hypothetical protein DFH11DRAFT_1687606 [Phellopilus nigrolimitatus]|nr:hypothetical protein DFH11DRAFT_1687606 [Phellopilus nigrolimitatus]